jgi:uncharacterized protein involved in type VI secretion and phage assembly
LKAPHDGSSVSNLVAAHERQQRLGVFGKYRGKVVAVGSGSGSGSNGDGRLGQLRVAVAHVYPGAKDDDLPWADCASVFAGNGYGVLMLPKVGDHVWLEFEGGNANHPIWSGGWFPKNDSMPGPADVDVRVIRSPNGHQVVLDDSGNVVTLKHKDGATITLSKSSITLEVANGSKIEIGTASVKINGTNFEVGK